MTIQADDAQTCQLDDLQRQLAEADAARRHAQAVSSELVQEKRALRDLLGTIKGELCDRYDGAPDSPTQWMGSLIRDIEIAQALDAPQDHLVDATKKVESETIASVTAWANATFGEATIMRQVERAMQEAWEMVRACEHADSAKIAEEAADVCICLYRVIGTLDPEAIDKKMAKNRARKWKIDGHGCAQHVGEE